MNPYVRFCGTEIDGAKDWYVDVWDTNPDGIFPYGPDVPPLAEKYKGCAIVLCDHVSEYPSIGMSGLLEVGSRNRDCHMNAELTDIDTDANKYIFDIKEGKVLISK